jgi:hypothetical protein
MSLSYQLGDRHTKRYLLQFIATCRTIATMRCASLLGSLVAITALACNNAPTTNTPLELATKGSKHIQADLVTALDTTCWLVEHNADAVKRCFVSVDGISRPGIYMQAPGLCSFPVFVHAGARFVSWISFIPEAWVGGGDGAEFVISVISADPPETVIVGRRSLDPGSHPEQRQWSQMEASLEPWGGMPVIVQLGTLPGMWGDNYHDWCVWGEPTVSSPPLAGARYRHSAALEAIELGEVRLDHDFLDPEIVESDTTSSESSQPLASASFHLADEERQGTYVHPPWSVSRTLVPGPQARLVGSLGLVDECWSSSNGVDYVVTITRPGALPSTVFRYWLCPRVNACDRNWVDVAVDLSMYSGETITVTLRTEAGYEGNLSCDSAVWARPVVVSRL